MTTEYVWEIFEYSADRIFDANMQRWKDGVVEVLELQADGGKRMRAPDYFRGHPIEL